MVEKDSPGATGAPSDIEMMRHRLVIAQLIPFKIPVSPPEPWLLSTFPAKISAWKAHP
jgi:hypothetical protein